jgi:hypothetical protein
MLAEHPDVLVAKLVSGKVTYIHRRLWAAVVAVGRARESWQMGSLSREARGLLERVDREPVQTDRGLSKAAGELEKSLLVYSEQVHTEGGAHARRLESWGRRGFEVEMGVNDAKSVLEDIVAGLNGRFSGGGRLPWNSLRHRKASRAAGRGPGGPPHLSAP